VAARGAVRFDCAPIHLPGDATMKLKSVILMATLSIAAAFALPGAAADADSKASSKSNVAHEKEGERHEPAEGTQQHKMKVCNIQAHERDLHGDERRAFMSSCLRK
jgi:hypothetical protein